MPRASRAFSFFLFFFCRFGPRAWVSHYSWLNLALTLRVGLSNKLEQYAKSWSSLARAPNNNGLLNSIYKQSALGENRRALKMGLIGDMRRAGSLVSSRPTPFFSVHCGLCANEWLPCGPHIHSSPSPVQFTQPRHANSPSPARGNLITIKRHSVHGFWSQSPCYALMST